MANDSFTLETQEEIFELISVFTEYYVTIIELICGI
jgi:hypothetical protein